MANIEPYRYEPEEILRMPKAGGGVERCYVISGFADFTFDDDEDTAAPIQWEGPEGSRINDDIWVSHNLHLIVGPEFLQVLDVSPTAAVAGFSFRDSDETDSTGIELENCRWDTVGVGEPNPNAERIRLKIQLRMCGGRRSKVTKISYHLVAVVSEPSAVG